MFELRETRDWDIFWARGPLAGSQSPYGPFNLNKFFMFFLSFFSAFFLFCLASIFFGGSSNFVPNLPEILLNLLNICFCLLLDFPLLACSADCSLAVLTGKWREMCEKTKPGVVRISGKFEDKIELPKKNKKKN